MGSAATAVPMSDNWFAPLGVEGRPHQGDQQGELDAIRGKNVPRYLYLSIRPQRASAEYPFAISGPQALFHPLITAIMTATHAMEFSWNSSTLTLALSRPLIPAQALVAPGPARSIRVHPARDAGSRQDIPAYLRRQGHHVRPGKSQLPASPLLLVVARPPGRPARPEPMPPTP